MLHISGRWAWCLVKAEGERVLAKATQRTREQESGSGLSHPHAHSFGGALPFPFKSISDAPSSSCQIWNQVLTSSSHTPCHPLGLGRPPHTPTPHPPQHPEPQLM